MGNNRTEKMIKNIILFFIASFGTKFLSFFLVPFYTSLLTTEEYGTADYLNTVVSLILPILMLDISDAIMYFAIQSDKKTEKYQVLKYGMEILKKSILILAIGVGCVAILSNEKNIYVYCLYVFLYYVGNAYYFNILAYMRSDNLVNQIVITSIVTSAVTLLSNVVLILFLGLGGYGLLISSVIGLFSGNIYCSIKINYLQIEKIPFVLSRAEKVKMLRYSIPLIFAGLAWWVNSSLDRFFITYFYGMALNGIYAVANKIPTILSAVHSVIYQAMQISVFTEIRTQDGNDYVKKLYDIYNFLMVTACSIIIIIDRPLAALLFKGEFYVAWQYVPALLISTVLYSVSGYITILAAVSEETKTIATATVSGAIVNGILNFILIPKIELFGAVISTIFGYFVVWFVLIRKSEMALHIKFSKVKSIAMYVILIFQWIVLLCDKYVFIFDAGAILFICVINFHVIKELRGIVYRVILKLKAKIVS